MENHLITREKYLIMREKLNKLVKDEAKTIVNELISNNYGKTVKELRRAVIEYTLETNIPDEIVYEIKKQIDDYISNLKVNNEHNK